MNGHVLSRPPKPMIVPSSSGNPVTVNHAPLPPPSPPASATPDLPATPAQPSPKALGKRRAVTPPLQPIPPPHPTPDYLSQQKSDAHLLQSAKGNLDIFLHDYSPAKPADGASTSAAAADFLDQGVLPSPFPSPTTYGRLTLGGLSGPSHAYQGSLLTNSTFDNEQQQLDAPDPWLQFIQEDTEYEFATVDPTLLGDHAPVVAVQAPALGAEEPIGRDASALFDSPQLFPSSISSSRASPMSDVFDPQYQQSASMTSTSAPDRVQASLSPTASDFDKLVLRRTAPRKQVDRVDEVDTAVGRLYPAVDTTVTSQYCSSSSSSSASDDDLSSDGAHRPTKVAAAARFQVANLMLSRALAATVDDEHPWPQTQTPNRQYCHQCRRKTTIAQMACTCGKTFCARCLGTRYARESHRILSEWFSDALCFLLVFVYQVSRADIRLHEAADTVSLLRPDVRLYAMLCQAGQDVRVATGEEHHAPRVEARRATRPHHRHAYPSPSAAAVRLCPPTASDAVLGNGLLD